MEAHSIYSVENSSLGEEQRRPSWEGQEDGGEATQASLGRGVAGSQSQFQHSTLPFQQRRSRDEQWALLETQLGGCARDSRRTKVKRSLRLQVVQRRRLVTSSVCKGGFSHRPVLTNSWGPPAALLQAGKVSIPTSVASRTFPGAQADWR